MQRLIVLLTAALVAGASAAEETPASPELKAARKLYTGKCAKCHELYDPMAYSPKDWQSWVGRMRRKARLKPEQEDLLLSFREALRPPAAQGKPPPRALKADPRSE